MPTQTTATGNPRQDLAGSLMEFDVQADAEGYIAQRVAPVMEVAEPAGVYGVIPIESMLTNPDLKRAPKSGYARDDYELETKSWATTEKGKEEVIDQREARVYRNWFDVEAIATSRGRSAVLRDYERRISELVFNTSTYTGSSLTTAVSNEWDDKANATPVDDVEAACQKIYDATGIWPNALIINEKVFRNLRLAEDIRARIEGGGAGSGSTVREINAQKLAEVFGLEQILVAGGSKNTAKKGQAASVAQMWSGEYAMVAKVATSNDIQEPCIARTFHWSADGSTIGGAIESYGEDQVRGDIIRVRHETDESIIYKQCGHLLSNITT
jgi:hypothetical protein